MKAALIIIGNEILSGRTQDKNLSYLANWLNEIGIQLSEVRVIRDEEKVIIDTVNHLRSEYDYVFTTGGIGPTHDDITSLSIARAFGVELEVNDKALSILKEYYKDGELTEARMKMTMIPVGAELVDNPVSKAPGFKMDNVFVMAGIPSIMQGMLEGARRFLKGGDVVKSMSIDVYTPESNVAQALTDLQKKYNDVEIGSYPFSKDNRFGTTLVM
ncbi:MAG: competence/damage-inducible protein A, partial [Pelagibacteraceae bacterium]|nr:competence/damage-inducible protein A [Pelagibacteraceae bacterium]